jgi:membrane protease YdiL (CAAX protease family)
MDPRDLTDWETFHHSSPSRKRTLIVAIGYAIFCAISFRSRSVYPLFGLVVLIGIAVPFMWARLSGSGSVIGLRKDNLGVALAWGLGAGLLSSVIGLALLEDPGDPYDLPLQLLIGIPFWVLVIAPFQEFFFRGWMQSELGKALGEGWGLLLATAGFTLWHYLSPILDLAPMPLGRGVGVASTFIVGLAYGYVFRRTGNLVSPWLAHAISGIIFTLVGAMDFLQALG